MMYQVQRDNIEYKTNFNTLVLPYLEGIETSKNNRDSDTYESNLNIYEKMKLIYQLAQYSY